MCYLICNPLLLCLNLSYVTCFQSHIIAVRTILCHHRTVTIFLSSVADGNRNSIPSARDLLTPAYGKGQKRKWHVAMEGYRVRYSRIKAK